MNEHEAFRAFLKETSDRIESTWPDWKKNVTLNGHIKEPMQSLVWKIVGNQVVHAMRSTSAYRPPDEFRVASEAYTVLRDRLIQEQGRLNAQLTSVTARLAETELNLAAALGAERREAT